MPCLFLVTLVPENYTSTCERVGTLGCVLGCFCFCGGNCEHRLYSKRKSNKERTTKRGIYLVDDLWADKFPSDYGTWHGSHGFSPDNNKLTNTLLFFPTDLTVTDKNKDKAETICSVNRQLTNGFFPSLSATDCKIKYENGQPVPGTYVFVTSYPGDDRVEPMTTSVSDKTEQFVVTPDKVTVTTKATPEVYVGEPAHDTAIVKGTVPAGASLARTGVSGLVGLLGLAGVGLGGTVIGLRRKH